MSWTWAEYLEAQLDEPQIEDRIWCDVCDAWIPEMEIRDHGHEDGPFDEDAPNDGDRP
jgi:hypothetical protein